MIQSIDFYFYYHLLFFISAYFALVYVLFLDAKGNNLVLNFISNKSTIVLVFILIFLIGLRGYKVGTDTWNYYGRWNKLSNFEISSDIVFYELMIFIKNIKLPYQMFLFVVASIYFSLVYRAYYLISKKNNYNLYLFLFAFLSFFFSISTSINVMRQGLSLVLLVLAYSHLINNNRKKAIIFSVLSLGFHLTAIIPILLWLIVRFTKKIKFKWFLILYIAGIVLSLLNFGVLNFAPFLSEILISIEDKRASYLRGREVDYYVTGFKPQFVVFNTVLLALFLFINKNIKVGKEYESLLRYYIIASFLFFMAFQIPFSDRWGLFGWFAMPILIAPIFNKFKNNKYPYLRTLTVLFLIFVFIFFNILYK